MARARFKPNSKGIGALLRSAGMEREMLERAETVVSYAQAEAPHQSGGYAESFSVESGQSESPIRLGKGDRAWARVRNSSPHAAAVEFGNRRRGDGDRPLGKAVARVTSG